MKSRTVLCGKAASGKDYMRKILEKRGYSYGISYTTRPKRVNENEKDYYFLSKVVFEKLIENEFFYEYVEFNGWYYGTSNEQWYDGDDIFVMTRTGVDKISNEDRETSFIIYFDIPESVRRERLAQRNYSTEEIEKRILADEEDFRDFKDYDIKITDPNF